MHGGAVALARAFLEGAYEADLLLATDMLDLTTFLALTRAQTATVPTTIYFHENQLAYPWSPEDRDVHKNRDKHYGFINYVSALAADRVFFNSAYNCDSFLSELRLLLKHFPDYRELRNVESIRDKSEILPLGLDLRRFDAFKLAKMAGSRKPLLLWNHRWEFDKNPADFFRALFSLQDDGVAFEVAVLGECFSSKPEIFTEAQARLGDRMVHYGYCEHFSDYAHWLWRADILPVTSRQDFFGASIVEAVYCGCYPILPRRLAYPELFSPERWPALYYDNFEELASKLGRAIRNYRSLEVADLQQHVAAFDWRAVKELYHRSFQNCVSEQRPRPNR